MCGITGIINFNRERKINPETLRSMAGAIVHRGPDDEGFYINNNIGLGFRRLSIIDLSTGHQPLSNENESIWIIFNGEIYNYKELQKDLIRQGHIFRTQSDTETIVHLYEQYGTDCLKYLRGMFAFAIWDSNKNQLFCARDRFGIKPFYYYLDNERMVFGSEIKALLKSDDIDRTLSPEAIDSYFAFGYITSDLSIYKEIKKLQPAHYILLSLNDNASFKIESYWNIKFEPDFSKNEMQWEEEIQNCLSETVKMHMISDVPLGAFLSGGIDSGSVVSMMAKNSTRPIKTFSIGFKDERDSELKYARELAKKYNCEHHEQIVEPKSVELIPDLVKAYDEPFGDPSAVPTYYVSKLAREFVTVALSGDGGDELFAGYNSYSRFQNIYNKPYNFNIAGLNNLLWGSLFNVMPHNMKGKSLAYILSKSRKHGFAYMNEWTENERKKYLRLNSNTGNVKESSEHYKVKILKTLNGTDYVTAMQYLDMKTYMVDDILTKVDRASMLNSLEVRVPLLDHKFAELTFKIPSGLKVKAAQKKYIFRKAMSGYLPASFFNLPKKGFSAPISAWFKGDLKNYIGDTLLANNPRFSGYLDKNHVKRIVLSNQKARCDSGSKVWALLMFEEWLKQNG